MPTMPSDVLFGKVVGQFILADADTADADRLPNVATPTDLVIKFTPGLPLITTTTPVTKLGIKTFTATVDADGFLVDAQSAQGIWLPVGTYTVSYTSTDLTIDSHGIEVLATHDDATPLVLPTAIDPGTPLTPTQYTELDNRVTALELGGGSGAPDATTTTKGLVQLAGDLGGSGTSAAAPRIVAASTTVAGKVELATTAETTTGTDDTRATTPAGVKAVADTKADSVHTHTAAQVSDFTEASQDVVGAMVAAAGGSYDDGAGTITLPGGTSAWTYVVATVDTTDSTGSAVDVTGLSITGLANGLYEFEVLLLTTTTAFGTAPIPSLVWPASVDMRGSWETSNGNGGSRTFTSLQSSPTEPNASQHPASSNIVTLVNTVQALMRVTSMGTDVVKVTIRTEVAATTVTVKADSLIRYRRIAA